MNNRVLVIVTEGLTDEEFYKKVMQTIKENNNNINYHFKKIDYICAYGISNFQNKIPNKFKYMYQNQYKDYDIIVCLCYDKDVFYYNQKPPIDRDKLKNDLLKFGATKVIQVAADKSIEDFFLIDIEGIKKYLRLPRNYKFPKKSGLELIKQMFKDANKTYFKGERVAGLIDQLNINLILSKICNQLVSLCHELGYSCNGDKCKNTG